MPKIQIELNDEDAAFLKEHLRETGQSMDDLAEALVAAHILEAGE